MRRAMSAVVLSIVVLLPSVGNAQLTDEPVLVNGLHFYPTREFRIFDATVMTQVTSSQGGSIYVDSTLAPNTVVYVPVGGKTMRAYRVGEPAPMPTAATIQPARIPPPAAVSEERPVATAGSTVPAAVGTTGASIVGTRGTAARTSAARGKTSTAQTTLQPDGNQGIWIEYEGARYFADGAAAVLSEARFTKIGDYRGFPVYRAADDTRTNRIWVTSAIDGPIAPFVKR